MSILKKLAEYLYIKKRNPDEPHTKWMGYMNGMNRLSLIMFLVVICIILVRLFVIPLFK